MNKKSLIIVGLFLLVSSMIVVSAVDYCYDNPGAVACDTYTEKNPCEDQDGCKWSGGSTGYCYDNPGATACADLGSSGDCGNQDGCTWGCIPQCAGKECGVDDSCGLSCGTCGAGEYCSESGTCGAIPASRDIIMRLSGSTNAHGEVYSQSNYEEYITYSGFFGFEYPAISDPHDAAFSTNQILKLSAATNAHAGWGNPIETVYPDGFAVYYGDLECSLAGASTPCGDDEVCVVTLSSPTNAHLALCGTEESYDNKLCCSSEVGDASGYCQTFTSNNTCLSATNPINCTWYPPSGNMSITSGNYCCGPEESWSSRGCIQQSQGGLCQYQFTLDRLLSRDIKFYPNVPISEANIDLSKDVPEYCSPVSREINYGFWTRVSFY